MLLCPHCSQITKVLNTIADIRVRKCLTCGFRFTTEEIIREKIKPLTPIEIEQREAQKQYQLGQQKKEEEKNKPSDEMLRLYRTDPGALTPLGIAEVEAWLKKTP